MIGKQVSSLEKKEKREKVGSMLAGGNRNVAPGPGT
jgi:hypothetical protein